MGFGKREMGNGIWDLGFARFLCARVGFNYWDFCESGLEHPVRSLWFLRVWDAGVFRGSYLTFLLFGYFYLVLLLLYFGTPATTSAEITSLPYCPFHAYRCSLMPIPVYD